MNEKELIRGEIADYFFDKSGILYSYSKGVKRTVQNISRNADLVISITGGRPVPLLIYLCDSPMPDKAARQLSAEKLPQIYSAMAMVSKPGLSTLIMSILFRFKPPPIPMRSFTNDTDAREWLKQFITS
jgi:hypothetical protein